MGNKRQKIPLLLKIKRLKNSAFAVSINAFFNRLKPPVKFNSLPKRILLFRNDRIGDAVVTLPVIRDIKANYPEMKIDVLVSPSNRFVFEGCEYVDKLIELKLADNGSGTISALPFVGGIFQFIKYLFLPYIFSPEFRKNLQDIRSNNYDAAADLVGLKRNAIVAGTLSGFTIGPGKIGAFLLYDYYSETNWVSADDNDFMTRKIERTLTDALGLELTKRNDTLPLIKSERSIEDSPGEDFDIIFHLGTSELRKLSFEKERDLIDLFADYRIVITDSARTERFIRLEELFRNKENVEFRLYPSLKDMVRDCLRSRFLFCYDGGQSHYLAQYIRTFAVFGPGSAPLWKPYEFEDYDILKTDSNGTKAFLSAGKLRHIALYRPMWCSPCFDIGCNDKPCLNDLDVYFIHKIIKKYCLEID